MGVKERLAIVKGVEKRVTRLLSKHKAAKQMDDRVNANLCCVQITEELSKLNAMQHNEEEEVLQ